jgi:transcriptional regulator with XRE-family HTH domain
MTEIRALREKKGISQDAVAQAMGTTFSRFVRIEAGTGRTTEEEIRKALATLRRMPSTGKKLVGRPYSDPEKQAAMEAARGGEDLIGAVKTKPRTRKSA